MSWWVEQTRAQLPRGPVLFFPTTAYGDRMLRQPDYDPFAPHVEDGNSFPGVERHLVPALAPAPPIADPALALAAAAAGAEPVGLPDSYVALTGDAGPLEEREDTVETQPETDHAGVENAPAGASEDDDPTPPPGPGRRARGRRGRATRSPAREKALAAELAAE